MKIPFNKVFYTGREIEYVHKAFENGDISGDGHFTDLVSSFLEEQFSIHKGLMTTSATHALELASMLIGLKPGDEVIMPSFTFPSTANAVALHGGKPVFAEIDGDTLNIDPEDIENRITEKTKAIIPVHYGGIGCEMDRIMDIALKHKLYVIEDAAQGFNGKYKGRYLGTWGHMGCYSFHGTKNYVSGEGGAIAINIDDKKIIEKAEIIRQKGTNRNQFLKGEVDKYCWVDIGSSYVPSDILMAILYSQLQMLDSIAKKRKRIHNYYSDNLSKHVKSGAVRKITTIPQNCESNYHLFYMIFDNEKLRDNFIDSLSHSGIKATTHFVPLHSSIMGEALGYKSGDFPITESVDRGLVRLPMYTSMTEEETMYVVKSIDTILKGM